MKINKNTKNNIKVRLKYHKEKEFKKNKNKKNAVNVIIRKKKKYNYINNDDINAYNDNNCGEIINNITNVIKNKNRKSLILQWDYENPCDK